MAIEIQAPHSYSQHQHLPSIFLAGSIDNGQAEDWQKVIIQELADENILILNPRRSDWDQGWPCDSDYPDFRTQVEWELEGLRQADLIIMYFAPSSKAPISLLELGLFASSNKMYVCCPTGYWRKGNVDIVCEQYQLPQFNAIAEVLTAIKEWLPV